jgi:hypothetical protein
MCKLLEWQAQMKGDVWRQNGTHYTAHSNCDNSGRNITQITSQDSGPMVSLQAEAAKQIEQLSAEVSLAPALPSQLKDDQFRAYDIICWHLDETLAG